MAVYREMRRYGYHLRMLGELTARLERHALGDHLRRVRSIRRQLIDREWLTPGQEVYLDDLYRRYRIELPFVC